MMRNGLLASLFAALLWLGPGPAPAVQPGERLDDPALEARARDLSAELRCLVCPNQSIDDSNAPLARDLRLLVRERLVAGDTNDEVLAFLTARYGDFVRLAPPVNTATALLWFGPLIVLVIGLAATLMIWQRGRSRAARVDRLTDEEERRLTALIDEPEDTPRP